MAEASGSRFDQYIKILSSIVSYFNESARSQVMILKIHLILLIYQFFSTAHCFEKGRFADQLAVCTRLTINLMVGLLVPCAHQMGFGINSVE